MDFFSNFNEYRAISEYIPILLLLLGALVFAVGTLVVALLVRPNNPDDEKLSTYECGIEPATKDARGAYNVRYFLIAVLFIIFDVETIFLFPWAVVYKRIALFGFIEMMLFIFILLVGYFYAWRKGALEWV
ncbi:MAG: NADH-quinone oxidoreductase subunit A [Candidatus Schekmanbacteria bacterium]|nr:MAG: NADH-quinone oxidoreductase subunit A [Candidatus Schekmanbacteria bacterium]